MGCFTSQQHQVYLSQGQICSNNCAGCFTDAEAADQTSQSKYTDTGPTDHMLTPGHKSHLHSLTPGAWQGRQWRIKFEVTAMTPQVKWGFEPRISRPGGGRLTTSPPLAVIPGEFYSNGGSPWGHSHSRRGVNCHSLTNVMRVWRGREGHGFYHRDEGGVVVVVVCWLLKVPATCQCISGTDLHRQFYVLPHWAGSCRSNFPSHPVTVYWHRADQSQRWPYNARRLVG